MEIVFTVLILLLAVALSGIMARTIPFPLPLPLVQIAIGAVLAWPKLGLHVTFNPELFMLLFIPPLLFADGWRIPKRELHLQLHVVLLLAFGLAFISLFFIGYLTYWLIPGLPLPIAFALAAVLSPTDVVALSSIVGKDRIPPQLMHILEGEALMNDASGLVALKFAVAAALTGMFSLRAATVDFLFIAAFGLAVGAGMAWLFNVLSVRFLNLAQEDDPAPGIVMTLLVPFATYLFAEHFGGSGVLAAVAAGMVMNRTSFSRTSTVATRVRTESTWAMIEFVFKGMVFILLGLQLPHIIGQTSVNAQQTSGIFVGTMIGYAFATLAALYAIRFAWVWLLAGFANRRAIRQGQSKPMRSLRALVLMTIGGVRGAITLAAVLSIPLVLPNGKPVAGRDMAIFIASGVILGTLLVAYVVLPFLLRDVRPAPNPHAAEEYAAREAAAQAAIRAIASTQDWLTTGLNGAAATRCADTAARVMDLYRRRLAAFTSEHASREQAQQAEAMELKMLIAAVRAERNSLYTLYRQRQINDETLNKLIREVDLAETSLATRRKGVVA